MKQNSQSWSGEAEGRVARLIEIGVALSAETDLDALLEKIVQYAREITCADAGTLYELADGELHFRIIQNDTLGVSLGGVSGGHISLAPVPLLETNVSAHAALTGLTVRVDDVYASEEFDFEGPRKYDAQTGYRSRSMLVVPLRTPERGVIGVLQLMNAVDAEDGRVVGFRDDVVSIGEAFASQAAVAITNARLLGELQGMMESMIRVLGVAIDAKSPYTGNHVQRVAEVNVALAKALSDTRQPPFETVRFSGAELEEIRIAGWLHDVGKVTTPVHVMDKATKLEAQFDRIELIRARFELIRRGLEIAALQDKLACSGSGEARAVSERIDQELKADVAELEDEFQFVARCNRPGEFVDEADLKTLTRIAQKTYDENGEQRPYLTDDEVANLAIRRGSLTAREIDVMRQHVAWTTRMLNQIPFTERLRNVPVYASQHHEKLNGTGYPNGVCGDDLPLQSRILAIADFYEALSAKDRPYKDAMDQATILAILRRAAEEGEIDLEILEFAVEAGVFDRFEQDYREGQRDGREVQDSGPGETRPGCLPVPAWSPRVLARTSARE
jgi:HD-GYP domain-containing protein (c-di-GMP phosphodiesterase class II)